MTRVWATPAAILTLGLAAAILLATKGTHLSAAIIAAAFTALAWLNSPLLFLRPVTAARARHLSATDGRPIVYWRPRCKYCMRLCFRLGRHAKHLHWVNIWTDPEAAAIVRAANHGNETVPTVVLSGQAHTNPDPTWLRAQLPTTSAEGTPGHQ
ncbi:glutaredoxin domain-containing protein [Nonomuraea sp. NPDC050310]|uniref:glutaredoxin domain-containing protein n=1 Tax=Nonomuraea sp. NPDC050310 TaxID=3154935 RepID=UPI0033C94B35